MTKRDLEAEWQKELKNLIDYHSEKIKNMSQEEEWKYLKENKVDDEIKELQKNIKKNIRHLKINKVPLLCKKVYSHKTY